MNKKLDHSKLLRTIHSSFRLWTPQHTPPNPKTTHSSYLGRPQSPRSTERSRRIISVVCDRDDDLPKELHSLLQSRLPKDIRSSGTTTAKRSHCGSPKRSTSAWKSWIGIVGIPTMTEMDEIEELLVGDAEVDEVVDYGSRVDEILAKVNELEKRVGEVEQFYSDKSQKQVRTPRGSSSSKDGKQITSINKLQQDASQREAAAAKRMHELMRQLDSILQQITLHRWSPPFMQPVNAEEHGLNDYHKVINKPMDISTIRSKMEGTAYKNVREIYADVRLVFKNAMKYHNEKSDIHVKAKTLLRKFEEKWLQLLPKVTAEEKRLEQEEAETQSDLRLIHEATHARMVRNISNELYEVDMHLEDLREIVLQQCRKISTEEKRNIAKALDKLPAEDVDKALEIVAEHDPSFELKADLVDLDLDAQSESTLWRLKFFVKSALEVQEKVTPSNDHNNHNRSKNNVNTSSTRKRRKEICDAIAKSAKRRSSNPS